jgi:cytochrome c peroxidase
VPILRGLAARAPYFHNGSADNLNELVNFYNARFRMNLNPQQVTDLVNFLNAL